MAGGGGWVGVGGDPPLGGVGYSLSCFSRHLHGVSDARSWRWLCSVANEVEVVAVDPVSQEPNTQPPHMLYTGVPVDEHVGAMAVAVRKTVTLV